MKTTIYASIIIIVGGLLVTAPAFAGSSFTVGIGEKYTTISAALLDMKDGDSCIVKTGIYRECIVVPQNDVTLRGEGNVIITGCDDAGKARPTKINGHDGLVFDTGKPVYEAFAGEQYLPLARFPNKTTPMTSNEDWAFATIEDNGDVLFTEPNLAAPQSLDDGFYVGAGTFSTWYSLTLPIIGLLENGVIRINSDNASSGYLGRYGKGKGLGYVIGAKAALNAPGEWYTDGKQVWLIPPDKKPGGYEFRTRLYGVVVKGKSVLLENLQFRAAAGRVDGDDVTFRKCSFEYISPFAHNPNPRDEPQNKKGQSMASGWGTPDNGTAGVFVQGDRFVAENCRFAKSWWCGMMMRGNRARIENCLFEDMNWIAKRCAALFSWGDDNVVRYCTFRNLGGSGIEGGNDSWIGQYAKRNIWEYNYIEDVCKLIVDQGFFYVNHQKGDNPASGSVWRYNVGKTVQGPKKGPWGRNVAAYYVDNNSSGYHIHNNIAIDAINPMKHNDTLDGPGASKDIWYYNNTFYKCGDAAFGNFGNSQKRDADLNLVNNLAVSCSKKALSNNDMVKDYVNNHAGVDKAALANPAGMDFAPTSETLKSGGVPVMGTEIPYVGAVDPAKGMWRYGADESKLPLHLAAEPAHPAEGSQPFRPP